MYAVILIKGKQYRVEEGAEVAVDKINAKEGSSYTIDKVLAVEANGQHLFGEDVSKASVKAKIAEHFRGDKITVLKYKNKSRYRRTLGHKQQLTLLKIEEINVHGITKPASKVEKPKVLPKPKAETVKKEVKKEAQKESKPKATIKPKATTPAGNQVAKKPSISKTTTEKEEKKV